MIRPTRPEDTPALLDIAAGTGVFTPNDVQALREVLDDYHDAAREAGHVSVTYERGGQVIGFAYYAPAEMTDRTWHLWWIAVDKRTQARGVGGELLRHAEEEVRRQQGRLLLIETSSLPSYEPTRRFYLKHGYDEYAVLRDYYGDDHHMVIYGKRITPAGAGAV